MRHQLIKGSIVTGVLMGLNTLLTMAVGIILARNLGPEKYGIYAFVLAVITIVGIPTKAGIPTLIVRETAKNQLKERWGFLRGLLKVTNLFVFCYCFVAATTIAIVLLFTYNNGDNIKTLSLLWALLLLPAIAFGNLRSATLRGLRKIISSQIPEKIIRPMTMIICLSTIILLNYKLNSVIAIKCYVIASISDFALGTIILMKSMPDVIGKSDCEYEIKNWANSLIPLSLFTGLKIADSHLLILIIGTFGTVKDVGLFRVASQGAALVALSITAINLVLSPYVARLFHNNEIERLQSIITRITRMVFLVSLPIAMVLIIWGKFFIGLVFGIDYYEASFALAIMSFAQLINVSAGSVAVILNMAGFEKESLKGIIVSLCLNVIISTSLVPFWGLNGAAIGYLISLVAWNIILMRATYRKVGVYTFVVPKLKSK